MWFDYGQETIIPGKESEANKYDEEGHWEFNKSDIFLSEALPTFPLDNGQLHVHW